MVLLPYQILNQGMKFILSWMNHLNADVFVKGTFNRS